MTSALLNDKCIGKLFLDRSVEQDITKRFVDDFHIKITDQEQAAGSVSGGNQQKIVLGRSLSTNPKLIILDEPTRGIDAAARSDVYNIIHHLREQGLQFCSYLQIWKKSSNYQTGLSRCFMEV